MAGVRMAMLLMTTTDILRKTVHPGPPELITQDLLPGEMSTLFEAPGCPMDLLQIESHLCKDTVVFSEVVFQLH